MSKCQQAGLGFPITSFRFCPMRSVLNPQPHHLESNLLCGEAQAASVPGSPPPPLPPLLPHSPTSRILRGQQGGRPRAWSEPLQSQNNKAGCFPRQGWPPPFHTHPFPETPGHHRVRVPMGSFANGLWVHIAGRQPHSTDTQTNLIFLGNKQTSEDQ